ncbi:enoyl-CoA hydratase-related protein [Alicyclobacillus sp.]|uniref:enoyl-CoA hydratase-related protein n=1 Tax=Alicyclobacillus sp. TaxID=61169 RepID=UPI0025C6EC6D|nr:enoyl-CoA hydratase-related protein [Alicyclobacillus sp.]MCL6517431.1 enoyl-CoA hydratase/isomerase family protein [Alicyclobacillus sp.]
MSDVERWLYLEKDGDIATVVFNRPDKRNALNHAMWVRLGELMRECEADRSIKVVIFRGVDATAFAAGADISEFLTLRATKEGAMQYNRATVAAEHAVHHLSKPTIAMVQGYCIGGGCEIAVACDFRFADPTAKFGITPAKLGHVYNLPATKTLVDLVGPAKAKDILFTGRHLDAEEALRIGLIDRIVPAEDLERETWSYARMIARNAQFSVRGSKYVIGRILDGVTEETEDIRQLVLDSYETEDYQEGVRAFLEKRRPNFTWS